MNSVWPNGPRLSHLRGAAILTATALFAGGCGGGMRGVDQRVDDLITQSGARTGNEVPPDASSALGAQTTQEWQREAWEADPATVNPASPDLRLEPRTAESDAEAVIARLEEFAATPENARTFDLPKALSYAVVHSREFKFAEEEYVLAALRLLIEQHRWGPRFFAEASAIASADGDRGTFDSALDLVAEFRATQRLPYGGEVSARALARATEDLHQRVSGEGTQSADIILAAEIPLLRGAGIVAQETLIQSERTLIYAAREFERFRREFLFAIASDYLDLTVALQRIGNARREVAAFEQLEAQQAALYEAGRSTPFDAAEAQNETLESIDRLNRSRESYRLALDRFKVRIGMPVDEALIISQDELDLPIPEASLDDAVRAAMDYRLDLQTERDRLADAHRSVAVAENDLLGDLDFTASVNIPTDDNRERAGVDFEPTDSRLSAGLRYSAPIDREIERLNLRQAQISLARAERRYDRFRDDVAVEVRGAARGIDAARFSLEIQEQNVVIAQRRVDSIDADPARADIRQRSTAIDALFRATDSRDADRRDLAVAILGYLLETGQLRVDAAGMIELPDAESQDENSIQTG